MIELGSGHNTSTASPDAFFARWVDHATWPQWSPDTDWVRVDGPVAVGTTGTMKPAGGPKVRFTVTACEPGREYTDTTRLPGARLVFQHLAVPDGQGTELSVRVTMSGPMTWLWSRVMGGGFAESAQVDLDRLVTLVETEVAASGAAHG